MNIRRVCSMIFPGLFLLSGCAVFSASRQQAAPVPSRQPASSTLTIKVSASATPLEKLLAAGLAQTERTTGYDPAYTKLKYPGGDVPLETGVCADVVVRAFRLAGIDLQKEVHEDMTRNFAAYPQSWGAWKPDANIDHRRVGNLMRWFERQGKSLPLTKDPKDYAPGDVVAWDLGSGHLHIGLVTDKHASGLPGQSDNFLLVHNIGAGARVEDVLVAWQVIGHYRYFKAIEPAKLSGKAGENVSSPRIGYIRLEELSNRAGCHYMLPEDLKNDRDRYVFFSCVNDQIRDFDAIINLDGQDVELKLLSSSGDKGPWRKGYRTKSVFDAKGISVQVDTVITIDCSKNVDRGCEGIPFDTVIRVARNNRKQVVRSKGWCGC